MGRSDKADSQVRILIVVAEVPSMGVFRFLADQTKPELDDKGMGNYTE
jgi:hypothetical protein